MKTVKNCSLNIKNHFDSALSAKAFESIKKILEGTDFCLKTDYVISVPSSLRSFKPDYVIFSEENNVYAIIEIGNIWNGSLFREKIEQLKNLTKLIGASFFVFTDGSVVDLYDVKENTERKSVNFSELKDVLLEKDLDVASSLYKAFASSIDEMARPSSCSEKEKILCAKISKLRTLSRREIFVIDKSDLSFKENAEKDIVKILFEFIKPNKEIYRYTSLKSLFDMIDHSSLRMFGIAGMNDKTEVNFVERSIFNEKRSLTNSVNKYFITSCSIKKDDLTLFRLYGDEAKGVCLVFDIKEKNNFKVQNVCYMDENDPVFGFLNRFISEVQTKSHRKFVLKTLNDWSHFVKPTEYEDEGEIRLMHVSGEQIKPNGWILSQPHNIVNPYKDFSLLNNSFPLKLKKVILGPKCPEMEMNLFQIKTMLNDKGFVGVDVCPSEIDSYR
ncbi:DUF2971 domain-containing protein [uncultured Fibrobacter sp.]|uniref:DUF2971 domain-containing protein n=1 Tax=uncultured Fibrobacter sp. TaxID=261512 RepID=UPI0025D9AE74|nr:DUF2971 domain-containing protein [uncultured Fibrobacter sp.]